jgi:hypothetical protein
MPDGIQWRDSSTAKTQKIIDAFSTASCLLLNLQSSLMFLRRSFNAQLTKKIKLLAKMLDPSPTLPELKGRE